MKDQKTEADFQLESREKQTIDEPLLAFTESEQEVLDLLHHERANLGDAAWAELFLSLSRQNASFPVVRESPCPVAAFLRLKIQDLEQRKAKHP